LLSCPTIKAAAHKAGVAGSVGAREPNAAEAILDARKGIVNDTNDVANDTNETLSDTDNISILPVTRRGRRSAAQQADYEQQLRRFAKHLLELEARFDFKLGARGWCYILEQQGSITKGEFDKAESLITECRKTGILPVDFTAEDSARQAENLQPERDADDPGEHAAYLASIPPQLCDHYLPAHFWDFQKVYIEMVVEKIDLKGLFRPVCEEFFVPITNAKGWNDINSRVKIMQRFAEHERAGRRVILKYCGDHDPGGLQMSRFLYDNLKELEEAAGWSPDNLKIDRFGLNYDFIEDNHLTWIDNLETGGGKRLDDPEHRQHNSAYVQEYIDTYGVRKCEANALVVAPEAGRELCRQAILQHISLAAVRKYKSWLAKQREAVRAALPEAMRNVTSDE
jgi:hypothetical protein